MKYHTVLLLAASLAIAPIPLLAKVTTTTQGDNERIMNTVAGPTPAKVTSHSNAQPAKKELKKTRIKPKPRFNDPN